MNKRSKFTWIRLMLIVPLLFVLVGIIAIPAQAAVFDNSGIISASQTIDDDLFMTAQTVQIDGTVNGLLLASGQTITINGTINGDAFLAGREVIVSETAKITGNLFAGAANIKVNGTVVGSILAGSASMDLGPANQVASNIYYAGYSLKLQPGSSIARSLYSATYQTILQGDIERSVNMAGAALELNGKVAGDVYADLGNVQSGNQIRPMGPFSFMYPGMPNLPPTIPPGLHVGPNAQINGKLTYVASVPASGLDESQAAGGIVYITPTPQPTKLVQPSVPQVENNIRKAKTPLWVRGGIEFISVAVKWMMNLLGTFISLLIVGGLIIWLLPTHLRRVTETLKAEPGPAAGWGIVTILLGYIGVAVALGVIILIGIFVTVISLGGLGKAFFGISLSSLALAFNIFILMINYVSKVIVVFLIGDQLMGKMAPNIGGRRIWALLLGLAIYIILWAIPCLGWLVSVVATVFGMGAIFLLVRSWRSSSRSLEVIPSTE